MWADNYGDGPQFSTLRYGGWLRHCSASATIIKRGDLYVRRCCNARPRPDPMTESALVAHWFAYVRYTVIRPASLELSPIVHDEQWRFTRAARPTGFAVETFNIAAA
jgi:hypothetical protein